MIERDRIIRNARRLAEKAAIAERVLDEAVEALNHAEATNIGVEEAQRAVDAAQAEAERTDAEAEPAFEKAMQIAKEDEARNEALRAEAEAAGLPDNWEFDRSILDMVGTAVYCDFSVGETEKVERFNDALETLKQKEKEVAEKLNGKVAEKRSDAETRFMQYDLKTIQHMREFLEDMKLLGLAGQDLFDEFRKWMRECSLNS